MARTEHLNAIVARCRELLDLAKKRTMGEWERYGSRVCSVGEYHDADRVDNVDVCHNIDWRQGEPKQKTVEDLEFIAACAGNAEAGWLATIAAIEGLTASEVLLMAVQNDYDEESPLAWRENRGKVTDALNAIIALWPVELLGVCDV